MDIPFSFSGIVSHFLTFSPCLIIALIYLFGATARKRKSIAGANQNINEVVDKSLSCASCGIAQDDDIKLMECDDCDLVRYCSDACQKDHISEHEEECKKRAAELRDELLFKQPDSCLRVCPICYLPLPHDTSKFSMFVCCSKLICNGCCLANFQREIEMRLDHKCPFCREPEPITKEEKEKRNMKRVEMNDPAAMLLEGWKQYRKGEHRSAFQYLAKAAELGEIDAHYKLSAMYREGVGTEKDEGKEMHHLEEVAISGHPNARHNLGAYEWKNGNKERAVKHWIIAAAQGQDTSSKALMKAFKEGFMGKEDLAAALRSHQAAVDAARSQQRKVAEVLLSK